jgi:type II secretory pathway component PulJ
MQPESVHPTFDQFVEDTSFLSARAERLMALNRRHALLAERFQQAVDCSVRGIPTAISLAELRRIDALLAGVDRQRLTAIKALQANIDRLVTGT